MQHQQAASQCPLLQQLQHPAACPSSGSAHSPRQLSVPACQSHRPGRATGTWLAGAEGAAWDPGKPGLQYRWVGWDRARLLPGGQTGETWMGQTSPLRTLPVSSSTFTLSFLSLQDLSWLVRARTPTQTLWVPSYFTQRLPLLGVWGGQSYPPEFNPSSTSAFS